MRTARNANISPAELAADQGRAPREPVCASSAAPGVWFTILGELIRSDWEVAPRGGRQMIDLPPRIDLLLCKYALFLSTRAQRCTVEIRYLDHMVLGDLGATVQAGAI